jgi:hypothetical protein
VQGSGFRVEDCLVLEQVEVGLAVVVERDAVEGEVQGLLTREGRLQGYLNFETVAIRNRPFLGSPFLNN